MYAETLGPSRKSLLVLLLVLTLALGTAFFLLVFEKNDLHKLSFDVGMMRLGVPSGICRAWCRFDESGRLLSGEGVKHVHRVKKGLYNVQLAQELLAADHAIIVTPETTNYPIEAVSAFLCRKRNDDSGKPVDYGKDSFDIAVYKINVPETNGGWNQADAIIHVAVFGKP